MSNLSTPQIIRINQLTSMLSVSRTTIYRWERDGVLPPRINMGSRLVGWLRHDVECWLEMNKAAV